jgi:hypothetical protein
MKTITANEMKYIPRSNKYLLPAILVAVLLLAGLLAFLSQQKPGPVSTPVISQNTLEEQYGLRVNLVAVTAAGGLVDVRMKLVDAEKAKLLLSEKSNFPSLWIEDKQVSIVLSDEVISQEITFENGASLYLMFPNAGTAVQTGTDVTIRFGTVALEPIIAK